MLRTKLFILSLLAVGLFGCGAGGGATFVEIETDFGKMKVKLYDSTPLHRDNFIKLAKEGYYDGLLFHRVIQSFMIQGGDPDSRTAQAGQQLGMGGPGYTIPAEIGAKHIKGALSAARTENPEKASSGSQFYIVQGTKMTAEMLGQVATQKGITYSPDEMKLYEVLGGTPMLDNDYTVFGEVVEGLEIIDRIAQEPGDANNRPNKDVKMKVRVLN